MIRFAFTLDREIDKALVSTGNLKLLADVEGRFEIFIHDQCLFSDEYFPLLEFGIGLKNWLSGVRSRDPANFSFVTMSFAEGPILEFVRTAEGQWKIFSLWQKFQCDREFAERTLTDSAEKFLRELETVLERRYALRLDNFVRMQLPKERRDDGGQTGKRH